MTFLAVRKEKVISGIENLDKLEFVLAMRNIEGVSTAEWRRLGSLLVVVSTLLFQACAGDQSDQAALVDEKKEIERLRQENQELPKLRAENEEVQRLRKENQEIFKLRAQYQELIRLRKENEQLKSQLAKAQQTGK